MAPTDNGCCTGSVPGDRHARRRVGPDPRRDDPHSPVRRVPGEFRDRTDEFLPSAVPAHRAGQIPARRWQL